MNVPVDLACWVVGVRFMKMSHLVNVPPYHHIKYNRTPKVLLGCYLCSLPTRMVPADFQDCHGFPSVANLVIEDVEKRALA